MAQARALAKPILYYFPGNKQNPFGHVAIECGNLNAKVPTTYLTYGMGEGKVREPYIHPEHGYEYYTTLRGETNFYNEVVALELPPCETNRLIAGMEKFINLNRSDYNLLTHNCASAVLICLREAGYVPQDKIFSNPLRPQAIAKWMSEMILDRIRSERKNIITSDDLPLNKIINLLRNDVQRLQEQIKYDQIAHLSLVKSKNAKLVKINILEKLIALGEKVKRSLVEGNFDEFYQELLKAAHATTSKTATNLHECLYLFPKELLSQEYSEVNAAETHNVDYYKRERNVILQDDELDEAEMVRKLIKNDVNRLSAQIKEDRAGMFSKLKDPEKKAVKIKRLTALLAKLEQPHIDYDECLRNLYELKKDKEIGGKTTDRLQDCISHFPYDKLSNIESMRHFFIKVYPLVAQNDVENIPARKKLISQMRALIPNEEEIWQISCKDVYEKFNALDDLVKTHAMANKDARNFCEVILAMAHDTLSTRAARGNSQLKK